MFSYDQEKWTLEEKIRLLELFIDKDSGLWEDRANALQEEFSGKRPTDFFTQTTVKRELNNIFNKPNPEHHIFGMPTHPRGKEAAELWLKHFRRELEEGRERRKQMFMVAMRKQLDIIRRYQQGKLPKEELDALLEEARQRDAQRPDKEQYEEKIKQHMAKAYFEDVKNVRTFADYFRFLRGVRIPTPAKSPTPIKIFDESCPEIMDSFQVIGESVEEMEQDGSFTSLYISLDKSKELFGESEARVNLRPLPQFESIGLRTRVAKYAEANEKCLLTKSGPEEFKEHTIPIRRMECIENGIPIIAKGREKGIDAKQVIKPVAGPAEATDISTKHQRMPRMQVAATPPTEKPKTRKRKHELSDETDAELEKPNAKRLRTTSKTITESDAIFTFEAFTSLCISLDKSKELFGESEARVNLRPLPQFESIGLRTRVAKYAEANEKCLLTKSGPEEFKEHTIPIRRMECIENDIPIIAKDAKQVIKPVAGPAEATDISTKQQRMPRMQVAATPPTEKPKTRKRKADLSFDGMRETDAESEKGQSEKRARNFIRKESVDDKSVSSSALSSPQSFVVTPPQPLISEVAATAKLRSQLRRAAIASSTPSPAVDSVADNRLFLKPGKRSSTAVLPKQILLTLWRDIHSHRYAPVFSFPVSEELVHGYHTAIKKPMDLKTLKTNIESGEVNTLGKFSYAILKMFANAVMYNSTGHYVNNYAKEMVAYALKCIEVVQFPTGQFHAPPPSRQSNGSSSEGGAIGGGGAAKFTIAWATTLIKPKGVDQKKAKGRNDEELTSSSSQDKEREADQRDEEETRRLFQRRRMYNKKYTFTSTI
ncbi:hypothetical protein niasHT_035184 [Heterodera trifolii]|uniref:Bromo domain-containing protein n=1 Tax=Heterodera trifolii TaxID=157864 RepID=A0ABD2IXH6_9BILA